MKINAKYVKEEMQIQHAHEWSNRLSIRIWF